MARLMAVLSAAFLAVSLGATDAAAAERVEKIHFKAGASGATVKSKIKGWDSVTYQLEAKAGQVLHVLFSPNGTSCYFNVLPPGGGDALHVGSSSGNEFGGTLGMSGTYGVDVYLMRNDARRGKTCSYSISFEISG